MKLKKFGALMLGGLFLFSFEYANAQGCPSFAGTFVGTDILKRNFTSRIDQKDCESITIDDQRYGKKITYLMNGKIVENPLFVKEAKNTTHIRNFFAGDFLVTETYNEKDEEFVKVATLIMHLKTESGKRYIRSTVINESTKKEISPFVMVMDMSEKK